MSSREGTADLLKGFAVLFMIQVHIMEQFATPDTYDSVIGRISLFLGGPPCAPVFMAVMGYFLAVSSRPLAYFLSRGAMLFLAGILLNAARSANLLIQIVNGRSDLDPWFFILGNDIFTLAGLSIIVAAILRIVFKNKAVFYFLMALIVAAVSPQFAKVEANNAFTAHISAFFFGNAENSYFPFFPWFSYVLFGFGFRTIIMKIQFIRQLNVRDHFIYFIPLWIFILVTLPYAANVSVNLLGTGGYYHHGILFFGWVILFMISYLVVIKLIDASHGNRWIFSWIKWMGKEVTLIYIIQWIIIGNLATKFYRSLDLFYVSFWLLAITSVTILTGFLLIKAKDLLKGRK